MTINIAVFCIGLCIGMTYTFVVYEIIQRKRRRDRFKSQNFVRKLIKRLSSWLYDSPAQPTE